MTQAQTMLEPCPFCGSAPIDAQPMIYCGNHDCMGPRTTAECRNDAIVQWNTRATTAAAQPVAWQTMDTAPRDGTSILMTGVTAGGSRWFMDGEVYAKGWIGGSAVNRTPNYWRPCPEFPTATPSPLPAPGEVAGGGVKEALQAVVSLVGKQEPDKLDDDLLYGLLAVEKQCRHALATLSPGGGAEISLGSWPALSWWEAASVNAEFVASLGEWSVTFRSPRGADWRDAGIALREKKSALSALPPGQQVDLYAGTCEDRRLIAAGYKVCSSGGDSQWHWRAPNGRWNDGYKSESAAVKAALAALPPAQADGVSHTRPDRGAATE